MTRSAQPSAGTPGENLRRDSDRPSFMAALAAGRVRWELVHPFPEQSGPERERGDRIIAEMSALLRDRIDPTTADTERRLPDGLVDELKARGYLKLAAPAELGGHELSPFNVFRVLSAAASWSPAIGPVMSADNGLGAGAYLPALPAGPLREWVRQRLADGIVSCTADAEPTGAHNRARRTVAEPTAGGSAYLLTGEKVFVANASIADVLVTTATVREGNRHQLRLFFVDGRSEGIKIQAQHDFLGLAGFPNGNLRFDRVRVPRERMLVESRRDGKLTPATTRMVVRGRMYHVAAPSLAFARLALRCARDFTRRRVIDGRPLGDYQEIQRQLLASLADTFAIETVAQWCLLADHDRPVNPLYEQLAAKNISSLVCWRVVDRTMSLLGAEGLETMPSKLRRGAPPLPMERLFRDARVMRITGGVDFQLDNRSGRHLLARYYRAAEPDGPQVASASLGNLPGVRLEPRNRAHARRVETASTRLAETCRALVREHPDRAALFERERLVILLSRIANELLTMALTLARASQLAARGGPSAQHLADDYCTRAEHRLDRWWRELAVETDPMAAAAGADLPHATVTAGWLHGDRFDFLLGDLVTDGDAHQ